MRYIEPHGHMVSRTTDDYQAMVMAGCAAVCEPAFWAGFDRKNAHGFYDYFLQLTEYEPRRAKKYHLPHYSWLCINPKEAEDTGLADDVIALIPELLAKPNVLGIGEIGLNKNSRNELLILEKHLQLAADHDQLVLVHTPHLEDKLKGTRLILEAIRNFSTLRPERVIIDHVEEHTAPLVLDRGFWAGITLYPESKATPNRAIDMLELYGHQRIWLNSACDWGHSDPLAVPRTALEMRRRGYDAAFIDRILYQNPLEFLSQNPRFKVLDADPVVIS
jgi:uncharacterized protein